MLTTTNFPFFLPLYTYNRTALVPNLYYLAFSAFLVIVIAIVIAVTTTITISFFFSSISSLILLRYSLSFFFSSFAISVFLYTFTSLLFLIAKLDTYYNPISSLIATGIANYYYSSFIASIVSNF